MNTANLSAPTLLFTGFSLGLGVSAGGYALAAGVRPKRALLVGIAGALLPLATVRVAVHAARAVASRVRQFAQ